MQAMGAYGYRGFFERKPRFLQSVPFAARNIERLLERRPAAAAARAGARVRAHRATGTRRDSAAREEDPGLTVHVGSFSYRRGYPEDHGGHGGGYVFDCRAIPNPGRQLEYQALCGLDTPVVGYLEGCAEVGEFWRQRARARGGQVREYLRRGFNSLTIMFGCTGGQHRSVYFAERMGTHLADAFPQVHVRVTHREKSDWPSERGRPSGRDTAAAATTSAPAARGARRERIDAGAGGG